jgi:hypothetical protein
MRRQPLFVLIAVLVGGLLASTAFGQAPPGGASGSTIFGLYCASCHGTSAKGDGPLASSMRTRPADLTGIARRNGGTFPADQVARIIDGRDPVKGHGGGDMPVWGDAFAKSRDDTTTVEEKIQRLVNYLQSVQAKQ